MYYNLKYRIVFPLFLLAFTLADVTASAQLPVISTKIDTNQIVIGDQISLQYEIEYEAETRIAYPALAEELVEGIEIVGAPQSDSTKVIKDTWKKSLILTITSFDTGIYYLPPQPFVIQQENIQDTLYSKASYLEVLGVAVDTTQTIRDIKAAERMPVTLAEVAMWLLPILLLGAIAFLVFWYYKRNKKDEPMFKPLKPQEPPYITALRELDKLKAKKLWQQKQEKEYYSQITHIVRWYIEGRFKVDALEQTSDEMLSNQILKVLDKTNYENLEGLLNLADLVKFAKGEPTAEENMQHLENAYNFVKHTREETTELSEQVSSNDN